MRKLLVTIMLVMFVFPATADALTMHGAKARHWNWAREAQTFVPLPDARVDIVDQGGCPWVGGACMYPSHQGRQAWVYLPPPGAKHGISGWGYGNERVLFLHELGHVADYRHLTNDERNRWIVSIGSTCSWANDNCPIWRKGVTPTGGVYTPTLLKIAPRETFAEAYAACALNLSRFEVEQAQLVSYGWIPTLEKAELCGLVRSLIG